MEQEKLYQHSSTKAQKRRLPAIISDRPDGSLQPVFWGGPCILPVFWGGPLPSCSSYSDSLIPLQCSWTCSLYYLPFCDHSPFTSHLFILYLLFWFSSPSVEPRSFYSTVIVSLISTLPYDLCALGSLFPSLSNYSKYSPNIYLFFFFTFCCICCFSVWLHTQAWLRHHVRLYVCWWQKPSLMDNRATRCFVTHHLFHFLRTEQEQYLLGTVSTYVQKRLINGCWDQWILS